MSKKPNVLIFFTDDQRFDTIHALGNEEIKTPNLDEFSKNSVVFTHAHIMGGTCGAVCMPSRAMLQTGRNLFSLNGIGKANGGVIPKEHVAMPEYLQQNGYFTQHVGKWHQDKDSFTRCYDNASRIFGFHGKGGWYSNEGGHYNPVLIDFDPEGKYDLENRYHLAVDGNKIPLDSVHEKIAKDYNAGKLHTTDIFCDAAIDFIEKYEENKPFYLYLANIAPHDPRNAPEEYHEMYSSDDVSTPQNFLPVHPFDNGELYNRDERLEFFPRSKRAVRRHIADYYAMISHIDTRFGDVIQALKDKGIYDDTIVIFAADNGLGLGQHGLLGKQSVYEHSIRVPFMIKPAKDFEAKHTNSYIYLFDVFPTICEMCGLEKPDSVNGTSFAPVVFSEIESTRNEIFAAYRNFQRCYKNHKFKLIEYYVGDERNTQLFDLENDPKEINNLYGKEEYVDVLKDMREKLLEQQNFYRDPLVVYPKEVLKTDLW